jgi:hypothetical protein
MVVPQRANLSALEITGGIVLVVALVAGWSFLLFFRPMILGDHPFELAGAAVPTGYKISTWSRSSKAPGTNPALQQRNLTYSELGIFTLTFAQTRNAPNLPIVPWGETVNVTVNWGNALLQVVSSAVLLISTYLVWLIWVKKGRRVAEIEDSNLSFRSHAEFTSDKVIHYYRGVTGGGVPLLERICRVILGLCALGVLLCVVWPDIRVPVICAGAVGAILGSNLLRSSQSEVNGVGFWTVVIGISAIVISVAVSYTDS